MENMFTEILKASPGLAVAIFLVVYFMRYVTSKDVIFQTLFDRFETIHNKTIDKMDTNTIALSTMTEVIRKCQEKK